MDYVPCETNLDPDLHTSVDPDKTHLDLHCWLSDSLQDAISVDPEQTLFVRASLDLHWSPK